MAICMHWSKKGQCPTIIICSANTGITIGFLNTSFSILESNGQLDIRVGVMDDTTETDIVILVHYSVPQSNLTSGESNIIISSREYI